MILNWILSFKATLLGHLENLNGFWGLGGSNGSVLNSWVWYLHHHAVQENVSIFKKIHSKLSRDDETSCWQLNLKWFRKKPLCTEFELFYVSLRFIIKNKNRQTKKRKTENLRYRVFWYIKSLSSPIICSPPGSSVLGILQVRMLEWVAIPFSRGSSQPRFEPWPLTLQADSLPFDPPGKSHN